MPAPCIVLMMMPSELGCLYYMNEYDKSVTREHNTKSPLAEKKSVISKEWISLMLIKA